MDELLFLIICQRAEAALPGVCDSFLSSLNPLWLRC